MTRVAGARSGRHVVPEAPEVPEVPAEQDGGGQLSARLWLSARRLKNMGAFLIYVSVFFGVLAVMTLVLDLAMSGEDTDVQLYVAGAIVGWAVFSDGLLLLGGLCAQACARSILEQDRQ